MKKENWKVIKDWENYLISDKGKVKSIARKKRGFHHGVEFKSSVRERILKNIPRKISKYLTYMQVGLHKNGKTKVFHVHRLVSKAFIKNPKNKPQVNHIDGNGLNNNINNLEWVTGSENSLHAFRVLGREIWSKGIFGEKASTSKPVLQKTLDGKLVKRWGCGLDAVREGGFESSCISRNCKGQSNSHKGFTWEYAK